jgi:type VI secretion system protein ImpM
VNAAEPVALSLVRWLEDGNEALHRAGVRLHPEPLGFVFRLADGDRALVGAIAPGEDKVGRSFPLAAFAPASARELARDFPLVPALYRPFLDGARALLAQAPDLTAAQIAERLSLLPLPGPSDATAGEAWSREAAGERAAALLLRLFGEPAEGQRYYAFHTFQLACQQVRGRDPGRTNIALDCPCSHEQDAWPWLELSRRALGWPVPPPFFWRGGPAPALVISLGTPPPSMLLALSDGRESQRIWPLKTRQRPAVSQAQKALPAAQIAAIDGQEITVGELLDSLSPA